jgi:IS5 family transposase
MSLTTRSMSTASSSRSNRGLMMKKGTVVDATLIAAPSSPKNAEGDRRAALP